MNLYRALLLVACGFGLLAEMPGEALGAGGSGEPNDPGGITGTNGLTPDSFQESLEALIETTQLPLFVSEGSMELNAASTGLLWTDAGVETFEYALACGYTGTPFVFNGKVFGEGILETTAAWGTQGLDADARADLFACMAAHFNPEWTVPIRLAGRAVRNVGESEELLKFSFREALWTAEETEDESGRPIVKLHVWPLDLDAYCGSSTSAWLEQRVCMGAADCHLVVEDDVEGRCVLDPAFSDGVYRCDGREAIMTWLQADEVPLAHPDCATSSVQQ